MNTKGAIRRALEDAISWQSNLLDAHAHMLDSDDVEVIKAQLAVYRRILKRRYPARKDPLKGAKLVDINELRKR